MVMERRRVALLSLLACVAIGVPVWWHTTKTYRAELPLDKMDEIAQDVDTFWNVRVHMVFATDLGDDGDKADCYDRNSYIRAFVSLLSVTGNRNLRVLPTMERVNRRHLNLPRNPETWSRVVNKLAQERFGGTSNGQYVFVVVALPGISEQQLFMGTDRTAWLVVPHDPKRQAVWEETLSCDKLGKSIIPSVARLAGEHLWGYTQTAMLPPYPQLRVPPAREYELVFYLLNGDPDSRVTWDIDQAVAKYLGPFSKRLARVHRLSHASHILPFAELAVSAERQGDVWVLPTQSLPHFVNENEWNLDWGTPEKPVLHMMLYLPKPSQRPLRVASTPAEGRPLSEENLSDTAFLIDQFGGVVISDGPVAADASGKSMHFTVDDLTPAMSLWIVHLRDLLGISAFEQQPLAADVPEDALKVADGGAVPAGSGASHSPSVPLLLQDKRGVARWEVDALMRLRTAENLGKAGRQLGALRRMVSSIDNLVIVNEIQARVVSAIAEYDSAVDLINRGKHSAAYEASLRALASSHESNFDPSLLALLYFPDDYKYAVYVPLFLPISVPLLLAVLKELRRTRTKPAAGDAGERAGDVQTKVKAE